MIIKGLFELVYGLLNIVLTPFQIIPNMPSGVTASVNAFLDFMFQPIRILLFFLNVNTVRALIPLVIIVLNMEHIYDGIMWVLKKLPFVGIE